MLHGLTRVGATLASLRLTVGPEGPELCLFLKRYGQDGQRDLLIKLCSSQPWYVASPDMPTSQEITFAGSQ